MQLNRSIQYNQSVNNTMSLIKHNRTISRPIKHFKNMKNIFRNIKHSCRMNEEAYVGYINM